MVMIRSRVRAVSVPVGTRSKSEEFMTSPIIIPTYNTHIVSNAALDDADSLTSASKRHDREFISDVNAKLANAPFNQPYVKKSRPPVYPNSVRSVGPMTSFHARVDPLDVEENDYFVRSMTPVTNEVIRSRTERSRSVPPPQYFSARRSYAPPPVTVAHPTPGITPYHVFEYPTYQTIGYDVYTQHPDRVTPGQRLNPVADLAMRQAHRNLDRIERELKPDQNGVTNSASPIKYSVYTDVGPRRRSSSYHGPRSGVSVSRGRQSISPSRSHTYYSYRSIPPVSFDSADNALNMYYNHLNAEPVITSYPTETEIRKTLSSVRGQPYYDSALHVYSSSLNGPRSTVVVSDLHPVYSYKPPSGVPKRTPTENSGLPIVIKPKVSDTRRKVRDVLCKVKADPNYFDE